MSNRRTGPISRFRKDIRDMVNALLRDGHKYADIIAELESAGYHGITDSNMSNYFKGAHQDWLKEQERLADLEAKREFALEVARANEGNKIHEAGMALVASQIYEVLTDFDPASLKQLLKDEPANYAQLVNAMSRMGKTNLEFEKYRETTARARKQMEDEIVKIKGGLSPETIGKMQEALNLL